VAARWQEIISLEGAQEYRDANAALMAMMAPPSPQAAPKEETKEEN
jgi:hypothetical protein